MNFLFNLNFQADFTDYVSLGDQNLYTYARMIFSILNIRNNSCTDPYDNYKLNLNINNLNNGGRSRTKYCAKKIFSLLYSFRFVVPFSIRAKR